MVNAVRMNVGDILMRPKFPGVDHWGVFAGNNLVCHNTPDKGEHISTIQEFANGQPMKVQHTGADASKMIPRINQRLANPKRYDLFRRNCQHTVNEIVYGVAKSPLVVAILFALALLLAGMILRRLVRA